MLRVEKLNKYYNRGHSNEIHVINNTTFALPNEGLVVILGSSGSGKTTLLNSLCGIDNVDSGKIYIDDQVFEKYQAGKFDDLRNRYFGYVFQNYNLIGDQSVYDNVAFSLKMIGITNQEEIRRRTIRALSIVKMDKYKNRLAKNLSGGQMQRVSIARAIVKDAKYILADEPTGNLDRKNTIITMSILKEISKTRLVVMVTHEKELAYAYADRIMEIKDGVIIKDENNEDAKDEYVYQDENTIYLGDFEKRTIENSEHLEINSYGIPLESGKVKIDFIVKNNQVFVKTSSNDYQVRIIDDNSLVKFSDEKQEETVTPLIDKEEVKIEPIDYSKVHGKYRVNFGRQIVESVTKLFKMHYGKRLVLLLFLAASFIFTVSVGLYQSSKVVDEKSFMDTSKNMISIQTNNMSREDAFEQFQAIKNSEEVYDIFFYGSETLSITVEKFLTGNDYMNYMSIYASVQNINHIENIDDNIKNDLKDNQVIIDKFLLDKILDGNPYYFQTEKTVLNQKILIKDIEYEIAGVVDLGDCSLYINEKPALELQYSNASSYLPFVYIDNTIEKGFIKVSENLKNENPTKYSIGQKIKIPGFDFEYEISGYFTSDLNNYLLNESDFDDLLFTKAFQNDRFYFFAYSSDYQKTRNRLSKNRVEINSEYLLNREEYMKSKRIISQVFLMIAVFSFVGPLIMLYFLMRSSTITKSKEIGIYRALGMRNRSVIGMYFLEIITITSIFAIPGYLLALLFMITSDIGSYVFKVDIVTIVGSLIMIVILIIFVGLLPVLRLIKKTPQKIMTKYDI